LPQGPSGAEVATTRIVPYTAERMSAMNQRCARGSNSGGQSSMARGVSRRVQAKGVEQESCMPIEKSGKPV